MLADLRKIWAIFTGSEQRNAKWMLALVVLMAAVEMLGVLSIMPFLSVLGRPEVVQENPWLLKVYEIFDFKSSRDFIFALGLTSIAIVLASSAFKTVVQHLINRFVHMLRHTISARLLSQYLHQPYEFFLTRNSSSLAKNVLSESDQLVFDLVKPLSQLIAQGAIVLAMSVLILCYNPFMALSIVATMALLYGAIYGLVRKRLVRIGQERQAANGQRYQACNEALGGIKDVKITHSADAYLEEFSRASRRLSRHAATNETLTQSPLYLVEATGYTGLIAIALLLLVRSNDIADVLPALGLYGFAAYRMLPSAQIMYRGFARLKFSSAVLTSIHGDLLLPKKSLDTSVHPMLVREKICLQNIRYAYPANRENPVLAGFNLAISVNTSIGIVGKSGSGKSTLMDILLGLLQPQEGTLSVDGTPINASNVAAWQRSIGYVPQHIYLSDASIMENIAFGLKENEIDLEAVERAARAAQIHDFVINELPQGYLTKVGERGVRLSGGQRQRVGIARALYRDPAVLLMDEATSALDTQTEKAVTEAVISLSGQKTIIIIAHREASLRNCQQIFSLPPTDIEIKPSHY